MEWLTCIKSSIDYIEEHLLDESLSIDDVSRHVYVSSYYLQTGFQVMTGYSIGEYIRNRRLSLAAQDLKQHQRVIDVALKYGYESQESFSKAFSRFHGVSPSKVHDNKVKVFNPLTIEVLVKGGEVMDLKYKIVDLFPLKLIGFVREFEMETAYQEIPMFWDEICEKYCYPHIYQGLPAENDYEQAIMDNCIGEYAICLDGCGNKFKYLIAGKYCGGKVPEGMMLYEFPAGKWAIFDCYGPCPEKLQELNTRIFKEWLPLNKDYELREDGNIEWYDCMNGEKTDPDYHTQIWLPVRPVKK